MSFDDPFAEPPTAKPRRRGCPIPALAVTAVLLLTGGTFGYLLIQGVAWIIRDA